MDEEELDQWYDSEKERLTEEYHLKLKKAEDKQREENRIKILEEEARKKQAAADKKAGKETQPVKKEEKPKTYFHSELKKEFLAKMKKLHKAYATKSKNLVKKNLKKHFQNHRMKMFKKKLFKPFKEYKDLHSKKKEEA